MNFEKFSASQLSLFIVYAYLQHLMQAYRQNIVLHLFGQGSVATNEAKRAALDSDKNLRIAMWHFPREFDKYVRDQTGPMIQRYRVPENMREKYDLSPRCIRASEAMTELVTATRNFNQSKRSSLQSSSSTSNNTQHPRPTPIETKIDRYTRQATSDPKAMTEYMVGLEEQIAALKLQIQDLKSQRRRKRRKREEIEASA